MRFGLVDNLRFYWGKIRGDIDRFKTKRNFGLFLRFCFMFFVFISFVMFLNSCKDKKGLVEPPPENEKPPRDLPRIPIVSGVARDTEPAWSPDGRLIAYVHGDSIPERRGIYLIEPSGRNKRLWYASGLAGFPRWSPDGQWIVFEEDLQIYKRNLSGDSIVQLTFEGRNFFPDWSPDGQWIAYDNTVCGSAFEPPPPNSCGVLIMKNDGSDKRLIARYGRFPTWHPSGRKVLYVRRAVTSQGTVIGDSLWLFDIETGSNRFLTLLPGDNRYPRYSRDGKMIAFWSQDATGRIEIWVMNSDGTNPVKLVKTPGLSCDWSPDGEWIVYTGENGWLWIMRKDGSQKRQLTFD